MQKLNKGRDGSEYEEEWSGRQIEGNDICIVLSFTGNKVIREVRMDRLMG